MFVIIMRNQTLNKLKKYSSLIGGAIITQSTAQAGIVYTNIDPDSVFIGANDTTNNYYDLDINNDGKNDFRFDFFHGYGNFFEDIEFTKKQKRYFKINSREAFQFIIQI